MSGVPLDTAIELPTAADTEALGERLADGLAAGDLVVLTGPLGAGKTVLVRGLARGLGVTGAVTSPTFVIAREHRPGHDGGVPLVHVDAYRLGGAAELDDLDLDTDLAEAVVAVEWGEGVAERLAERHVLVRLDRRPDDVRTAVVTREGAATDRSSLGTGRARTRPGHRHARRHGWRRRADRRRDRRTLRAGGPRRPQARRAAHAGDRRRLRRGRVALADLDAVVTGVGPGPFTGLRVGMVTAAALGDALGIPVHGVCSLDAIARRAGPTIGPSSSSPTPVVARSTGPPTPRTAAARRARTSTRPPSCRERMPDVRAAAGGSAGVTGLPVVGPAAPTPAVWSPSPRRRCAMASSRARWSRSTCAVPTRRNPARASG